MGKIIGFEPPAIGTVPGWSVAERAELDQMRLVIGTVSPVLDWDEGTTDVGDPWLVAIDSATDELALHVARIGREYVVLDADLAPVASGRSLRTVVETCTEHCRAVVFTAQETERPGRNGSQTAQFHGLGRDGMPILPGETALSAEETAGQAAFGALGAAAPTADDTAAEARPPAAPAARDASTAEDRGALSALGDLDRPTETAQPADAAADSDVAGAPRTAETAAPGTSDPADPAIPLDSLAFAVTPPRMSATTPAERDEARPEATGSNVIPFPMDRSQPDLVAARPAGSEEQTEASMPDPMGETAPRPPRRDGLDGDGTDIWTQLLDSIRDAGHAQDSGLVHGDALAFLEVTEIGGAADETALGPLALGQAMVTTAEAGPAVTDPEDIDLIGIRGSADPDEIASINVELDSLLFA